MYLADVNDLLIRISCTYIKIIALTGFSGRSSSSRIRLLEAKAIYHHHTVDNEIVPDHMTR
jgi:hypothetical protein